MEGLFVLLTPGNGPASGARKVLSQFSARGSVGCAEQTLHSCCALEGLCSSPNLVPHLVWVCFCDVMQITPLVFGYFPGAVLARVLVGQHFHIR